MGDGVIIVETSRRGLHALEAYIERVGWDVYDSATEFCAWDNVGARDRHVRRLLLSNIDAYNLHLVW